MAILTTALAGALVSCMPAVTTEMPVSRPSQPEAALAAAIYQNVNTYRSGHGVKVLERHPGLDHLAQQHSAFLLKNRGKFAIHGPDVSHYGFESRALAAQRFEHMGQVGENVAAYPACSADTAAKLVALWVHSPSHESNLRIPWTHTGVGVTVAQDGTVFATQIFGSYRAPMQRDFINSLRVH